MVALGLTIMIVFAMAHVFSISTKVVATSLQQSSFYSKLANAHAWIADEMLFELDDVSSYDTWELANIDSITSAGDLILSGATSGEGILLTPVSSIQLNSIVLPAGNGGNSSIHDVFTIDIKMFFANSKEDVITEEPDATPALEFSFWISTAGKTDE